MFTTIKTFLTDLCLETIPNKFLEIKWRINLQVFLRNKEVKCKRMGYYWFEGVFNFSIQTFQGLKDNIIGIRSGTYKRRID